MLIDLIYISEHFMRSRHIGEHIAYMCSYWCIQDMLEKT